MRRKKDPRITVRLVTALIASLVVGIVIDGLREDYLDLLKGYFGENGFKLLMRDGVMLDNVNYGTALDATAATAMIYSGASPSVNGTPLYSTPRR